MWNLLLPIALTLGGTYLAGQANKQAAQINANAQLQQQQQLLQLQQEQQQQAAPAQAYLRQVMASADDLTPAQRQQLADNRLALTNALHGSPFAGSGRTAAAVFKRADSDFVNTALDQNRSKAINAANTLYGQNNANAFTAGLRATGATGNIGTTNAQAGLATGQLYGKALGDIGSIIANEQRQSKYADRMSAIERSLGLGGNTLGVG